MGRDRTSLLITCCSMLSTVRYSVELIPIYALYQLDLIVICTSVGTDPSFF